MEQNLSVHQCRSGFRKPKSRQELFSAYPNSGSSPSSPAYPVFPSGRGSSTGCGAATTRRWTRSRPWYGRGGPGAGPPEMTVSGLKWAHRFSCKCGWVLLTKGWLDKKSKHCPTPVKSLSNFCPGTVPVHTLSRCCHNPSLSDSCPTLEKAGDWTKFGFMCGKTKSRWRAALVHVQNLSIPEVCPGFVHFEKLCWLLC